MNVAVSASSFVSILAYIAVPLVPIIHAADKSNSIAFSEIRSVGEFIITSTSSCPRNVKLAKSGVKVISYLVGLTVVGSLYEFSVVISNTPW